MPTRGRQLLAPLAVYSFLAQTWTDSELVILDDADDPSFHTPPVHERIRYHVIEPRLKIGAKRNRCCELSSGEIIAHFDDDDYSFPGRIEDQLDRLLSSRKQLTGYQSLMFDFGGSEWWMFDGGDNYYAGTSLMYRKEFWKQNQFPDLEYGEDTIFISRAMNTGRAISAPANDLMYARSHSGNTLPKVPDGRRWTRIAA